MYIRHFSTISFVYLWKNEIYIHYTISHNVYCWAYFIPLFSAVVSLCVKEKLENKSMKNNEFRLLDYLDPICEGHYIKDMTFPVIITTFIWLLLAVYWKGDCCSFSSTKSTIKNRLLIVNETDCGFSFVFRKFNKRKKVFFYFLLIEVLSFCVLGKWRTLC